MTKFFQLDSNLAYSGSHMSREDVDTWIERQDVLAKANEQAEEILASTEERVRLAEEKAYEDALQQAKASLENRAAQIEADWRSKAQSEFQQIEESLPRLLQVSLKKYLGELPREDILSSVVRETLRDPNLHAALKVSVNREDWNLLKNLPELEAMDVEADANLNPGEFLVHSENSVVRTGLDQQFDELNRIIMGQEAQL